jgi:hypothetical protein
MILPRYSSGIMILHQYRGRAMPARVPPFICRRCREEKALPEFSTDKRRPDGVVLLGRPCDAIRRRELRNRDLEGDREKERARHQRRWSQRWQREREIRIKRFSRRWAERDMRTIARFRLRDAVKSGTVAKPSACMLCGANGGRIDGHHHDYSRPFDVVWLCTRCHGAQHRRYP